MHKGGCGNSCYWNPHLNQYDVFDLLAISAFIFCNKLQLFPNNNNKKKYFIPKYFKIGSPLISPMPQHIPQRPSNDAKAPANTPATPSAERSHISPSASSKLQPHQQRSRKRAPNPDIAPLSPPPTISGQNLFNVNSIEVTIIWWALS